MGAHSVKTKHSRAGRAALIGALALVVLGALFYAGCTLNAREEAPAPTPTATVEPTPAPTATPEPAPVYAAGYLYCPDGLFRPESPLTAGELAAAVNAATGEERLSAADPEEPLDETSFAARLQGQFPDEKLAAALESIALRGDRTVTRAEAAVALNILFDLVPTDGGEMFPDVEPGYWAAADIGAAARSGRDLTELIAGAESGFVWLDGWLYCADADGYFLKNQYLSTLYFGPDGRYTSGSAELDGYVAAVIDECTGDGMTRSERLRAVYEYVRDNFTYLVRNYYLIGDQGWELSEALTMYSTGKGNCYCYAAAFWAAARGLGYDAKAVSGTYGDTDAPHGWVEILVDGERLTYDVEIEMSIINKGNIPQDLFAMPEAKRLPHGYIEQSITDNLAPRESCDALLPG